MSRPMARIAHLLTASLVTSLLSLALVADADAAPRAKGAEGKRFRLHIDSDVLGFTHYNLDGDNGSNDADRENMLGFGIGRLTLADSTLNSLGIGFGYLFLGGRAIIGGRFSLVVDGSGLGEPSKTTNFRAQFAPYFQWMFLPGSWIRPYVEGRIGIGGGVVSTTTTDDDTGIETQTANHTLYPFGGPGGGVHFFPVDYFSVDLGLNITLAGSYAKQNTRVDDMEEKGDWDNQAFILNVAAMVGVSTWF
jgi:hypothetical protein